jgi:hypothetical protein
VKRRFHILFLASAALLAACGGGDDDEAGNDERPLEPLQVVGGDERNRKEQFCECEDAEACE